ncbi:MAG: LysR family transcriptional regulator [Clostridiales bacterium]|jgi:LysR family transcriptional activator of glutamate synthase operon|nr:LysR family transcriptional regulator [Clostridiales bacterium]
MEIRDLQYFCLTAELEHVTKAADKLGVAQPFLTKIIRQIEKEIGVPLFDNIGRKIKLNEYGEVFYSHAKKILTQLDNLRNDMDELIERHARTIKIMTNTESHYPEIVMAYQKFNPNYRLAISDASRDDILEALKTGEADFGLCSPPLIDDPSKGIRTEIVFCEQSCVMLPPGHPMLGKKALRFDDMVGEALVTTSKESALRINLDHLMEKYDYHPQIVCESNDINLIIRAVKSGLGFAILPRSIVFSNPSIIKYCVESSLPDTFGDIGLSYSTSEDDARDASQFISFVKNFTEKYKEEYYSKNIWELHPDNEK